MSMFHRIRRDLSAHDMVDQTASLSEVGGDSLSPETKTVKYTQEVLTN